MSKKITINHECIILDACVLMNLYASRELKSILSSISESCAATFYVVNYEALTILNYKSNKSVPKNEEKIDLETIIAQGLLHLTNFESDQEKKSFLSFSSQRLDDGEAASMAIAKHRNWAFASDDKRATKIMRSFDQNIQIVSTPEILRHWQLVQNPNTLVMKNVIQEIEMRANFTLGRKNPDFIWWQNIKNI